MTSVYLGITALALAVAAASLILAVLATRGAERQADAMREWASRQIDAARESAERAQRLLESRNLAEFASAEEQLERGRMRAPPEPKPEPGALEEMWASRPPVKG